jgi:hypothetical protein
MSGEVHIVRITKLRDLAYHTVKQYTTELHAHTVPAADFGAERKRTRIQKIKKRQKQRKGKRHKDKERKKERDKEKTASPLEQETIGGEVSTAAFNMINIQTFHTFLPQCG